MTARVISGSKGEIAQQVADLQGEVREVIVFLNDPAIVPNQTLPATVEEMFREMTPCMAHAGNVDYSRESIYSRNHGE